MLDTQAILEDRIEFYKKDMERPNSINAFDGTFQISDHTRIHEIFYEFLMYSFKTARLRRVPLEEINALLNEVWEGPGSVEKILRLTHELRQTVSNIGPIDLPKKKTIIDDDDDDTGPVSSIGNESVDFDFDLIDTEEG
jgi:hypothetical protein